MKRKLLVIAVLIGLLNSAMIVIHSEQDRDRIEYTSVPAVPADATVSRSDRATLPAWDVNFKWRYHRESYIELDPDGYLNLVDEAWYVVSTIETVTCYDGYSALAYNVTILDGVVSGDGLMQIDTDDPPDGEIEYNVDIVIDSEESSITGYQWYRVSDLALMHDYRDIHAVVDASAGPLLKGTAVMDALNSMQASPPEEDYDFPLLVGDQWASNFTYHNYVEYYMDLPNWINNIGIEDEEKQSEGNSTVSSRNWCNNTATLVNDYGSYDDCYLVDAQLMIDEGSGKQKWWYHPPAMNFARWKMENMNFAGMVVRDSTNDLMEYDVWEVSTDSVSVGPRGLATAHPGGKVPVLCGFESGHIRFDSDVSGDLFSTLDVGGEFISNVSLPEEDDNTVMDPSVDPAIRDEGSHGLLVRTPEGSYIPKTVRLRTGDLSVDANDVFLSEPVIMAGEPVVISAKVYNLKDTFIGMDVNVGFYMDHGTVDEITIGTHTQYGMDHGPGFFRTFKVVWTDPLPGEHNITVVVDWDDLIHETDEENNVVDLGSYHINTRPEAVFSANETQVLTRENVFFDARASFDHEGAVSGYEWDFGDGKSAIGQTVVHNFTDDGIYNVSLTISDSDSVENTVYGEIEVLNRLPEVLYTVKYPGSDMGANIGAGDEVTFDASASSDPDGTISTVHWEFGVPGADSYEATAKYTYTLRDAYAVKLTVTDDDGGVSISSFELNVSNKLPVPIITVSRKTAPTNSEITFDASDSRDLDPQGSITSYDWNFDDGTKKNGKIVSHSFTDDGIFQVVLACTDNEGGVSLGSVMINVTNRAPVLVIEPPLEPGSENTISLKEGLSIDASGSRDDDGTIDGFLFDPGEGPVKEWSAVSAFHHSYLGKGSYTFIVKVRDDDGAVTEESYEIRVVDNNPPGCTISYSPIRPEVGQKVKFTAEWTDPDDDDRVTAFRWNFGIDHPLNGEWISNEERSVTYDAAGNYNVTLSVRDNNGLGSKEYRLEIRIYGKGEAPVEEGSGNSGMLWLWVTLGAVLVVVILFIVTRMAAGKKKGDRREMPADKDGRGDGGGGKKKNAAAKGERGGSEHSGGKGKRRGGKGGEIEVEW